MTTRFLSWLASFALGAALLYAIGSWLGWWAVAAIAIAGIGDTAVVAVRLLWVGRRRIAYATKMEALRVLRRRKRIRRGQP